MPDDQLIDLFKTDLSTAGIEEKYQHELYERQGIEQLREFLANCKRDPVPNVLHTEEWFEMQIGQAKVVGRIDRIDQLATAVSRLLTTRRAGPSRRKTPTRVFNFPSTLWPRAKNGATTPIRSSFITLRKTIRWLRAAAKANCRSANRSGRSRAKDCRPGI